MAAIGACHGTPGLRAYSCIVVAGKLLCKFVHFWSHFLPLMIEVGVYAGITVRFCRCSRKCLVDGASSEVRNFLVFPQIIAIPRNIEE
jgi:hypothetical protein